MISLQIFKSFVTPHCYMLCPQVLFDACCSESVVFQCSLLHHYKVNQESTALLQDVDFFTELLLSWRVWERASGGAWRILFQAIQALIRRDHPFHAFNIHQVQRVGLVQRLLTICRVRHSPSLYYSDRIFH